MGFLDDFEIDMDQVEESSFDKADGIYQFEVSEAENIMGTEKKPDDTFFRITYQLYDEDGEAKGDKWEWFTIKQDGEVTTRAKQSLGFLKSRLIDLGIPGGNPDSPDEVVGTTGTLQLRTKDGYQNIRNVKASEVAAPAKATSKVPAKATGAAKPNPFKKA
jgi:hypothetical protein